VLLDRLDAGERVRGRGFERLCKWVLENEPENAARLDRAWLWEEWPDNLGRSDAGIDLVDRTRDGKLWAVQAKHYGPDRRITNGDVNSFLAEAGRYARAGAGVDRASDAQGFRAESRFRACPPRSPCASARKAAGEDREGCSSPSLASRVNELRGSAALVGRPNPRDGLEASVKPARAHCAGVFDRGRWAGQGRRGKRGRGMCTPNLPLDALHSLRASRP
jgi:hypothetical protein